MSIKETRQVVCAGAMRDVTLEFGRTHYTATFPWGAVRVGMNYGRETRAGRVLGDNARVLALAVGFAEGQAVKRSLPVLRYALRPGACNGEMAWACRKMGLTQDSGPLARMRSGTIEQAGSLCQIY